jgi:hypothetical protein
MPMPVDRALVKFPRFTAAGSIYGKLGRGRAAIQDQYEESCHENNPSQVAATEQVLSPCWSQVTLPTLF